MSSLRDKLAEEFYNTPFYEWVKQLEKEKQERKEEKK